MTSSEIRKTFLDFFKSKQHQVVPSAPMVVKNDPTLMFTNAGMNQFKDIFLGNQPAKYKRVADTQKCLRVSGKHNDLEEVGIDTYHHTMFEMLGNWSFGDYFKKEAIEWAWELLTEVYHLPKDRIYVTVFEGDEKEKLRFDQDAFSFWKKYIAEDRILKGNKKDNFWEMGEQGPCGPCSEIHVDLRNDVERKSVDGKSLVNASHPQVIEIWNLVFMEFNRKADGTLVPLPAQHVDTGMGFERLCMALQGKTSNYDTDVFQPLINFISSRCKIPYIPSPSGNDGMGLIAMRVIADHIRAITCAIADGQLPSNNKAGYVIRRILRRAVRYGYSFLGFKEPFLHSLVPILAEQFKDVFPEIKVQQDFIMRVISEEEHAFLKTLEKGIQNFEKYISGSFFETGLAGPENQITRANLEFESRSKKIISGSFAFELYDTFGFPIDLTQLMTREIDWSVDMKSFVSELEKQKERSRAAAVVDTEDWIEIKPANSLSFGEGQGEAFVGYDELECDVQIIKYRKVKAKGKEQYQLVFNKTPFYAESGGQVGDTGFLDTAVNSSSQQSEKIFITDTQKENNLIIHFADKLPNDVSATFHATVDKKRRTMIMSNHSATHLMHSALKKILGAHVNQKGSLVNEQVTRFDFSHFAKVTDEELGKIEHLVNEKIRENIVLYEKRNVPIQEAIAMGATALFGEKYGDVVRVITFDPSFSRELCGGTHVKATGQIGSFKIISETAVAAGVRRVEAITADQTEEYFKLQEAQLHALKELLKHPKDLVQRVEQLMVENQELQKELDEFTAAKAQQIKNDLLKKIRDVNGIKLISEKIDLNNADAIKNISFELKNQVDNLFFLAGAEIDGKAYLSLIISDNLVKEKNLDATKIIRELAKEIQGGGGGQAFYATAGGKNASGIDRALEKAILFLN